MGLHHLDRGHLAAADQAGEVGGGPLPEIGHGHYRVELLRPRPPAQATGKPANDPQEIRASVETPARFDDEAGGDADADDPAIWINRADRAKSRVIGTAKNGGLRVSEYGLLVLHDGENTPDQGRVSTDFKLVDWRALSLSSRGE
ncbi:phytase [Actinoplanes sp. NPDC051513]|uniref:phytase n=1 Tax=Actinoplanes sp. NPDC051513 TaxID=3363908 RepID=UPI0037ABE649